MKFKLTKTNILTIDNEKKNLLRSFNVECFVCVF